MRRAPAASETARGVGAPGRGSPAAASPIIAGWSPLKSCLLLAAATILCLIPFSGRAFNIDDPLFIWAARQITRHPLDPFGFDVVWYLSATPMSDVTKNPPLASYFIAAVGSVAGWSERALHLAFLLPAIAAILGSYALARRLCRSPLLAAGAALLTPGFLVSSSTVMCDTLMLAFWVLAATLWMIGLERNRPLHLAGSGLLIAASALSKYFGASLIPLLLIYSLVRRRRLGLWACYLLIPVVILAGYQLWTAAQYGRGMLLDAAGYAGAVRAGSGIPALLTALACIGFIGGCTLPALTFAPVLWSWKGLLLGLILGVLAGVAVGTGWTAAPALGALAHRGLVSAELAICISGGGCVLALAAADLRKRRDAESLLLALWVLGTLLFAGFINWSVNARSVLPLIPAAGILLARRLEARPAGSPHARLARVGAPLLASGLLSLCIAAADAELANSARQAAGFVHERTRNGAGTVWFQGHWGFQYYMDALGARPVDVRQPGIHAGDLMVIPENNTNTFAIDPRIVASGELFEVPRRWPIATMDVKLGAGFYADVMGPLPFVFGPVGPERYQILRLMAPADTSRHGGR